MGIDADVTQNPDEEAAQNKLITEAGAEGLFVRQASGLVREIGWRDSFAISGTIIAFLLLFFNFAAGLAASQNGDFYLPILIAALVATATAFTYAQLVSAMPRSGGDYVFASRIAGPLIGAATGGALLLYMVLSGGLNTNIVTTLGLPDFFQTAGTVFHASSLMQFSRTTAPKQATSSPGPFFS